MADFSTVMLVIRRVAGRESTLGIEHPFPTQPTTLQGKSLPSRTRIILAARTVKLLAMPVWGLSYDGGTQKYGWFRMDNHGTSFIKMGDFCWGSPILGWLFSGYSTPKKDKRVTNIEESIPSKNDVHKHIHFFGVRFAICNNYKSGLLQSKAVTTPTCQHVERWSVKKSLGEPPNPDGLPSANFLPFAT